MPKNILTGLRSNSQLTLGNYLGAILPMLNIQKKLEKNDRFFLFLPDLHSIVTPINYSNLYKQTLENARIYFACGIETNRENVYIYRQSHISAHSELTWILSCFTYFGEMNKMTQFKEKSKSDSESIGVGLFTYPILMAADILLYSAEYVPLGDDQRQHLELARDIAKRFNNKFEKEIFAIPHTWDKQLEFMNLTESVRICSLQNPTKKMSKSIADPKGTILLDDDPKEAAKKVMSAQTDSLGEISWDWENQPGITNLLQIAALLDGLSFESIKKQWVGQTRYGDLKKYVAQKVEEFLINFQKNIESINYKDVENILIQGEEKVNFIANQTLLKAQQAVGVKN